MARCGFLLAALVVLLFSSFVFAHDYSDSGSGTDGSNPGSDTGSNTGSEPGSDTGSEPGSDTGSEPGSDTGSEPGSDTGSDDGSSTVECVEDSDCAGPVNYTRCCGGKCMDTRRNKCIKDRKCPLVTDNVCNQTCYNSSRLGCFEKSILCKHGWSLCGNRCFDPAKQFCGGSNKICNASTQWYCPEANRCYNHDKNYCCPSSKNICPLSTAGQPNDTCCPVVPVAQGCNKLKPLRCGFNVTNPNKCYTNEERACYNDETLCQVNFGYCGGRCYNTSKTYCPDGKNLCTYSQWFCAEAGKCYDPSTHYCCPGKNKLCLVTNPNCCSS